MSRRAHTALVPAFTLVAALSIGQAVARADAPAPAPATESPAARKVEVARKHAPPARAHEAATDDQSLYACHPKRDLSCTVIHETPQGIVVVTFRPSGAKVKREWSVVNAPAEGSGSPTGGTIYVVPGLAQATTVAQPTTHVSENYTPILD